MKKLIPMLFMLGLSLELWSQELSQELTQTIRGKVIDETSEITLPGATVLILNTEPSLGSITNVDGDFVIDKVPVGRHTVFISLLYSTRSQIICGKVRR